MKKNRTYYIFLIADIFLVALAFSYIAWLKPGTKAVVIPKYWRPFIGFLVFWVSLSMLGDKYSLCKRERFKDVLVNIVRNNFIATATLTLLMVLFHFFEYSRMIVFGTIALASALEVIFVATCYFHNKGMMTTDVFDESLFNSARLISPFGRDVTPDPPPPPFIKKQSLKDSILLDLKEKYLSRDQELFSFIYKNLELSTISRLESEVLNTHTMFNISNIEEESLELFVNLHRVNDFRRINRYFIQVNKNLKYYGYFVGCGVTIGAFHQWVYKRYPKYLGHIIYGYDLIFKRVLPKLPMCKELYFAITKGKNRSISLAEMLGRLHYCGFDVEDIKTIDERLYFVARKVAQPKDDPNPSYGPLIKLRRVGKNSKRIAVYKLRTMHPYSEYLQSYMYRVQSLEDSGKFKNDFRITGWGRLFRKLWMDELPQFINFFRGEVALFGVRALSEHYFNLYPPELQEMRTQFKPGLVPPYYADMPDSFEEILDSERRYLQCKEKSPLITDIRYFWRAVYNIVVKRARSK